MLAEEKKNTNPKAQTMRYRNCISLGDFQDAKSDLWFISKRAEEHTKNLPSLRSVYAVKYVDKEKVAR